MMFYDIGDRKEITTHEIIRSHFGPIYDIDCYPHTGSSFQFCFLTGSTDRTIRRWIVAADSKDNTCQVNEDKMGLLCDNFDHLKKKTNTNDEEDLGKVRALKLSPIKDLPHIVCGDSCGFLWVFDSITMSLIKISEEHQSEILGIDFCPIDDFRDKRTQLVATCSKDHLIKIYDAKNDYLDIKQIEDHKSAVIGVKFLVDDNDPDIQLVSADAKGTVSIRSMDEELQLTEPTQRELAGSKIYSIATCENTVILGTDKKVQMAQLRNNNSVVLKKSCTPATANTREFIKIEADDVGLYCIACSKKKREMSLCDIKAGTISQTFS